MVGKTKSPPRMTASTVGNIIHATPRGRQRTLADVRERGPRNGDNAATEAAKSFLAWVREHALCREWTVDDVWFLAESDFGEALDIRLPPRRVFLGELQKLGGVRVTYDRRVYDRTGRAVRKTTFYSFAMVAEAADQHAMKLAA